MVGGLYTSLLPVCVSVCVSHYRWQWFGNVTAAANTLATAEELFIASSCMRSVSYKGK
jgi:hypothetical protein